MCAARALNDDELNKFQDFTSAELENPTTGVRSVHREPEQRTFFNSESVLSLLPRSAPLQLRAGTTEPVVMPAARLSRGPLVDIRPLLVGRLLASHVLDFLGSLVLQFAGLIDRFLTHLARLFLGAHVDSLFGRQEARCCQ